MEALRVLEDLLDEQTPPSRSKFPPHVLPKSTRFPPLSLSPAIDIFTKLVAEDFRKLPSRRKFDNLTWRQRKAISELQSLSGVVFKPADKGGNIVVWPTHMYEREAHRQLRNRNTYERLSYNPTASFSLSLQRILVRALEGGIITKTVFEGLMVRTPKTPTFYLLPKIHKDAVEPPGRPIVSGIEGLCDPVCKFLDFYLKPLVESLPSYIKDTTDVLTRVDGVLVDGHTFLVTADVESLYTCIDHTLGLDAVRLFLGMSDLDGPMCGLLLELLQFVLTHNFFVFKDQFYRQRCGTAMGAACAPSYANLFLGAWERSIFGDEGAPAASHVLCWHRYIDDVLFFWDGTLQQLGDFMAWLNANTFNIRLTFKYDLKTIDFLDVTLEIDDTRRIQTDVYRKPTSVNSLLHAESAHNTSTIRAVPVGQFLRMRRICSTEDGFERQARDLQTRFRNRGYSNRSIRKGYSRARATARRDLLYPRRDNTGRSAKSGGSAPIRFISTFNHEWEHMRSILAKHWAILGSEPSLGQVIGDRPLMTSRRCRNLRDFLVKSHYIATTTNPFGSTGPTRGCFPCGHCVACPNVLRCSSFQSSDGEKDFHIKQHISCSSTNVIYYATCGCPLIYVGLTSRELRVRVREHVRDIRAAKTVVDPTTLKTIPRHFRSSHDCDPGSFMVRGIECVHLGIRAGNYKKALAQREAKWIVALDTMTPKGLNESLSFSSFL
ncbi:uncharacterized protein [Dendrobates tinctorius]|uniref:uncharacterized protein isoform X1 n=1 Tax=Dendrobates tinctorius TaxID=92724 RepID=UPI003CCA44ED